MSFYQLYILCAIIGTVLTGRIAQDIKEKKMRIVCPDDGSQCVAKGDQVFGTIVEGDVIKPFEDSFSSRNALINEETRWKNGVVKYIFQDTFQEEEKKLVESAMKIVENKTCIKFRHYEKGDDIPQPLFITAKKGCFATLGFKKTSKGHNLNLSPKVCFRKTGTILHELLHILGMKHEHARPDRDNYVKIIWDNIEEEYLNDFNVADPQEFTTYNLPYNYDSILHYPPYAFSKDRRPTIIPLDPTVKTSRLGQRERLTELDLKKINLMYNCTEFL